MSSFFRKQSDDDSSSSDSWLMVSELGTETPIYHYNTSVPSMFPDFDEEENKEDDDEESPEAESEEHSKKLPPGDKTKLNKQNGQTQSEGQTEDAEDTSKKNGKEIQNSKQQ